MLGLYPADKYNVGYGQVCHALAAYCAAPLPALRNLALQAAFAWLTGNGDLHAKNVSMVQLPTGEWSIAPVYDIPSTVVYGDKTLALTLGRQADGDLPEALPGLGRGDGADRTRRRPGAGAGVEGVRAAAGGPAGGHGVSGSSDGPTTAPRRFRRLSPATGSRSSSTGAGSGGVRLPASELRGAVPERVSLRGAGCRPAAWRLCRPQRSWRGALPAWPGRRRRRGRRARWPCRS